MEEKNKNSQAEYEKRREDMNGMFIKNWDSLASKEDTETLEGMQAFQAKAEEYLRKQINESHLGGVSELDQAKKRYLLYFISALLFEVSKEYNTNLSANGRDKADISLLNKMVNRISKGQFDRDVTDFFAAKLVINNSPVLKTDTTSRLAQQRQLNVEKSKSFADYKAKNIATMEQAYATGSRKEYFTKMGELIDAIIAVIPETATEERAKFEKRKEEINNKLEYAHLLPDDKLHKEDMRLKGKNFNFTHDDTDISDFDILLSDYNSRIDNDLLFQNLKNDINTIFKNPSNNLLRKFGMNIAKVKDIEKPNGYTDRTYILDTLAGKIEIKLQTEDQERRGNENHFEYKDKSDENKNFSNLPPKIPTDLDNKEAVESFRSNLLFSIPKFFTADITDKFGRKSVVINFLETYLGVAKVYRVPDSHELANFMDTYTNVLYENEDVLIGDRNDVVSLKPVDNGKGNNSRARSRYMILNELDLEAYINSDEFNMLKSLNREDKDPSDDDDGR